MQLFGFANYFPIFLDFQNEEAWINVECRYSISMNAMKTNPACKALYERLRANGKTGKQGLIAMCNKLLKQVFAVVKNNTLYQPNYCSAKP